MNKEAINKEAEKLQGSDRDFFSRVWSTPDGVYEERLRAIGFLNYDTVLDAGFGFGQWLTPLSRLNRNVIGIEYADARYAAVKALFSQKEMPAVNLLKGSVEDTGLPTNSVDAIFSYSVILCTDYRRSLKEFFRILKPGGRLYFNTNGLGWYLYNLVEGHNSTANFSPRDMAIEALQNTIRYFSLGINKPGACIVTPVETVLDGLKRIGYTEVRHGAEGTLSVDSSVPVKPFFKGEYFGHEGVIEFLCTKP